MCGRPGDSILAGRRRPAQEGSIIGTCDEEAPLFARAVDGDDKARDQILILGYKTIYAVITTDRRLARHEQDDVAHDAWIRFSWKWRTWKGESTLTRFAAGFARNAIKDFRRKMARLRHRDREALALEEWCQCWGPLYDDSASGELNDLMPRLLERLTARQRDILDSASRGEPQKETAARLGITRNTVGVTLFQARTKLMRLLAEYGYTWWNDLKSTRNGTRSRHRVRPAVGALRTPE